MFPAGGATTHMLVLRCCFDDHSNTGTASACILQDEDLGVIAHMTSSHADPYSFSDLLGYTHFLCSAMPELHDFIQKGTAYKRITWTARDSLRSLRNGSAWMMSSVEPCSTSTERQMLACSARWRGAMLNAGVVKKGNNQVWTLASNQCGG